jgi:hypothetical protein
VTDAQKTAAIRLMKEIILFTDRPDYSTPKSVRDAMGVLCEACGITIKDIYRTYGDVPEES